MKKEEKLYLRSLRLRSGLDQKDVVYLLGYKDSSSISKLEAMHRSIPLVAGIYYAIIFNVPLSAMLQDELKKVRADVLSRASRLMQDLKKSDRHNAAKRLGYLERMVARLKKLSRNV